MEESNGRAYEVYLLSTPDVWYVGSTTVGLWRRMRLHCTGNGHAELLWLEIQRVGWESFTVEVLESGVGTPYLAEAAWYDRLRQTESRRCLNKSRPGGYPQHSAETKARLSAAKLGVPSSRRGQRMDPTARLRMKQNSAQARKTHCPQGHPYDEANTRVRPNGSRVCRVCAAAYFAERDAAAKAEKMRRDVAARKARYQSDPEYRARVLASNRRYSKGGSS